MPAASAAERDDARAALECLAATAAGARTAAAARLSATTAAARRAATEGLRRSLASVDDVFGATHAAGLVLEDRVGARLVRLKNADGEVLATVSFERDIDASLEIGLPMPLGGHPGTLDVVVNNPDDAATRAVVEAVAIALGDALDRLSSRQALAARDFRQDCLHVAARQLGRTRDSGLAGAIEQARRAFDADAAAVVVPGVTPYPVVRNGARFDAETADVLALRAITGTSVGTRDAGDRVGYAVPIPAQDGNRNAALVVLGPRADPSARDRTDAEAFAALASAALGWAEAETSLARQERLRAGFVEFGTALASGNSDTDEGIQRLVEAVGRALNGSAAGMIRVDGTVIAAAPDAGGLVTERGRPSDIISRAISAQRVVTSSDARADARLRDADRSRLLAGGHAAVLAAPAGKTAALFVAWNEPYVPTDDDVELARHAAATGAAAVERSAVLRTERAQRERAQELQRIGALIAGNVEDTGAVLRAIVVQAEALLGADACALALIEQGRPMLRAVSPDNDSAAQGELSSLSQTLLSEVVAQRAIVAVENIAEDPRFAAREGTPVRYAAFLGSPILSAANDGAVRGVLAVYSERARRFGDDDTSALEALATSAAMALQNSMLFEHAAQEKERSEAIIASIADGIVVVDGDGRIVMWNRAAATITGLPERAALRRKVAELLRNELGDRDGRASAALLEASTGQAVELRLARGDREIWASVNAAELRDAANQSAGVVYALRDVSRERQLDQLKSDFVATVSHELRTPLTSIYGFAETLLRTDVAFAEHDRTTFLRYIATESDRLRRLVDGLLSVARLEAGGVQLDLDDVDVCEIVRDIVLRETERVRESHHLDLIVPAGTLVVAADRDKLRQIVINLVDNAIKYSPDGGRVEVTAHRHLDQVEIRVRDEGIGISDADQQNLFRKFFRADARMTRGIRGIGLGLYLTRGFVAAMGGRIRVESAEGEGSTFIVELPLRRGGATATAQENVA